MPRARGTQVESKFSRGLITEATGLNFPEDACTETFNCVFDDSGLVTRRFGIDYEVGATLQSITGLSTDVVNEYEWEAVNGDGSLNFIVVQVGVTLFFYKTNLTGATSPGFQTFTFDLNTHKTAGSPDVKEEICQFAAGNGALFVTHPYSSPFYIEYDPDTDTISSFKIEIKIRDFEGVDDGLEIDERPRPTLSILHKYNLFNQGWYIVAKTKGSGTRNVLDHWAASRNDFPSNADIWYVYKDEEDKFDSDNFDKTFFGNTHAPQGHYFLDAFNQDRSAASGIAGLTVDSAGFHRPSAVAFFAGRVWYGGVAARGYNTRLYFSQILETADLILRAGKAHQQNDPTSEDQVDLLDDDGGVVVIPEIANVIAFYPVQNSLLVFCTNGVWQITGGEGTGFKSTDYSVSRLSTFPVVGPLSLVDLGGLPMWINFDNVFTATLSNELGTVQVTAITEQTIKSFIRDIPAESKKYMKGRYNSNDNTVTWIYRLTAPTSVAERYEYNAALVLNTITGAFYPWKFGSSTPTVKGMVVVEGQGSIVNTDTVVNSALDTVVNAALDTVVSGQTDSTSLLSATKYLTDVSGSLTFSETLSSSYDDWFTFDSVGVDYESFGIGGFKVHGEGQRFFQTNYIFTFMEIENNASMFLQGFWGYGNSEISSRLSTEQQAYKTRTGFSHSRTKLKMRGKGEAMQLKFRSESGKPFSLVGWSFFETANAGP